MENKTILTAEEFISGKSNSYDSQMRRLTFTESNVKSLMIEFAKRHVKAALKEALESIPCLGSSTDIATYKEVEDAVLNSYPLENIK